VVDYWLNIKTPLLRGLVLFSPSPVYGFGLESWGEGGAGCLVDGVPTLKCLEVVFKNLLAVTSSLVILVLFVMLVIGGVMYLLSMGNPEKLKKAQATLKFAMIGFLLYISSYLIIKMIDVVFLGGQGNLLRLNIGPTP